MGMAAIARRSGARVRRRRLAACAASAVMAAALAVPGGAPATPPAPVVTATQRGPLKAQLTSSTGTHWAWTFKNAAGAVVGTSTFQNPLQAFPQAGDYTATLDATDDDPVPPRRPRADDLHVYNTPTANFTYTVLAGGTVQFTDTSTGEPTSWQWTFPAARSAGAPRRHGHRRRSRPRRRYPTVANPAGSHIVTLPVVVNGAARRRAHDHAEPRRPNTPVSSQRERVDRSQRRCARYSWDLNGDQTYGDATGAVQTRAFTVARDATGWESG